MCIRITTEFCLILLVRHHDLIELGRKLCRIPKIKAQNCAVSTPNEAYNRDESPAESTAGGNKFIGLDRQLGSKE